MGVILGAVLVSAATYFSDGSQEYSLYLALGLLLLAFIVKDSFSKSALDGGKEKFLGYSKGNYGKHTFSFEDGMINFITPSGELTFSANQIVMLAITEKYFLIYTPLWGCYIPENVFEKDSYERLVRVLEEISGQALKKDIVDQGIKT